MNAVRRVRGHTLVEMCVSLAVIGVILLACGSVTMMATRVTTGNAARNATQLQAAEAAAAIADDLNVALNFTQRTAKSLAFTVPDRLNSGSPQTVAYNWSGVSGTPLTRQFNGGPAVPILASAWSVNFDSVTRTIGPPPVTVVEQVVFSHDAAVGSFVNSPALGTKVWASQAFTPSLPFGTNSYTLTRVRWVIKAGNQDAVWVISVRPADLFGRPTATVLAQTTIYGSVLSTAYEWVDIPFTGLTGLNPNQQLCVVATPVAGSSGLGTIQVDQALLMIGAGTWGTTSNAGTTWSTSDWSTTSSSCSRIYVYGVAQ